MEWFPIGPDFVFAPRNPAFKRLSRRNETGHQCLVSAITVDPSDPATMYVCTRPFSGGSAAFRTRDGGQSWRAITDDLQRALGTRDPCHVAVNPHNPATIYLVTFWEGAVYVSNDRGTTWGAGHPVGGFVRKVVVDTRTSANPSTTVLYAATTSGVFRSSDGGVTWGPTPVLAGDVWSLEAHTPATGTAHFYAGLGGGAGAAYASNPSIAAGWTAIATPLMGGPAAGTHDLMLVGFCRANPTRAYAWVLNKGATVGLYTASAPTTGWSSITMSPTLDPAYGYYALLFAIAANSPGDGLNDILIFGNKDVFRSVDAGRTWTGNAVGFHVDNHSMAFSPDYPAAGSIPVTFIGNDGGIAKSTTFADPTVAINPAPAEFNEGLTVADSFVWQNLNHGFQSVALYQYGSVRGFGALSYLACQDTGIAAGTHALGWRGVADADATMIAAATSANEVTVWANLGIYDHWPGYLMNFWRDNGDFNPPMGFCTLNGSFLAARSRPVVGLDNRCLLGVAVRDASTTLTSAVTAAATAQAVTPASMANIIMGSVLFIDDGTPSSEIITVTATTPTSFTAVFAMSHATGASVSVQREVVARLDANGAGSQISQDFSPVGLVTLVAPSPTTPNIIYAATNSSRVFMTNAGTGATTATIWNEIAAGRPPMGTVAGLAVNAADEAFVLLTTAVTVGGVTSPLFKISGGSWQIQPCTGVPAGSPQILLADPVQNTVLYAHTGWGVYRMILVAGSWDWQDLTNNLPGVPIYDLAVTNVGTTSPKIILRAALSVRGVFEADVTAGAVDPPIALYVRDNFLDLGWTNPSPDFLQSPYNPTDSVTHYHCADVKIDARQNRPTPTTSNFYQSDPEGNPVPPLDHVLFDQVKDNSSSLPQADQAWVHVQVHNRSRSISGDLQVWAIYCNASAGVPALSASPSASNSFKFWDQFVASGAIVPNLPADSPWKSVGVPVTLSAIDVERPKIASWSWTIPVLSSGDTGHFCMVVFVHSGAAPVGESTRMIVDEITPTNHQIGQKNLHVSAPLPPAPGPGPGPRIREYVEFHNPTSRRLEIDVELDLRGLPTELAVAFRLTPLHTARPIQGSTGIKSVTTTVEPEATPSPEPRFIGVRLAAVHLLFCQIGNIIRKLFGLSARPCGTAGRLVVQLPRFESTQYEAERSALVRIERVRLEPFRFGAMLIEVENTGTLSPGAEYRFDVRQRVPDNSEPRHLGGTTFVVKMAGDRQYGPLYVSPSHDPETKPDVAEEIERRGREFLTYPSKLAEALAELREREYEITRPIK